MTLTLYPHPLLAKRLARDIQIGDFVQRNNRLWGVVIDIFPLQDETAEIFVDVIEPYTSELADLAQQYDVPEDGRTWWHTGRLVRHTKVKPS